MAIVTESASAEQLKSGITPTGLEEVVNAILAPILTDTITFIQIEAADKQRRQGKVLEVAVTYDDGGSGAVVLTNPYKLITFTGVSQEEAQQEAEDYRTANAGWWFADPYYRYVALFAPANDRPHIVYQFYSEDPSAGDNWTAGGGSGPAGVAGGDLSGTYPDPEVVGIQTIPIVNSATTSGQSIVYSPSNGGHIWYNPQYYADIASMVADQAAQVIGTINYVFTAGDPLNENGTYRLIVKTGSSTDYIKVADGTAALASEVYLDMTITGYPSASEQFTFDEQVADDAAPVAGGAVALVVATPTEISSVLVDSIKSVRWGLTLENDTTGEREEWMVEAHHDGNTGADATAATYTISGVGPNTGKIDDIVAEVNGSGGSQTMRLMVTGNEANWQAWARPWKAPSAGYA